MRSRAWGSRIGPEPHLLSVGASHLPKRSEETLADLDEIFPPIGNGGAHLKHGHADCLVPTDEPIATSTHVLAWTQPP